MISSSCLAEFDYVLESNDALNETLSRFILPTSNQVVVESDGYQLNVKEIRPPNMDETGKTKYPVVSLIRYTMIVLFEFRSLMPRDPDCIILSQLLAPCTSILPR